jgi:hypothetical protein
MMNPTTEQLPAYSNQPNFVGYPLFYIIDGETAMCACCATEAQGEAKTVVAECNWGVLLQSANRIKSVTQSIGPHHRRVTWKTTY